ncbi:CcoQ/FixQ family Cbb3-type cytochrome c oxidase assembly chaperone [Paucihalobacter ruber]|uniref:CcoQ/FixQ family Cbb3-type cytochrome c oxidase assembly chaperone n=1 Tax=Paucihalobacter ruber TaxID=2567861 RepID=A0A506PHU5_9FLAO|nr:CcoQ/FixQ family Cbb3-type cytochrome c oxidase assembly chaperone [Paucihalobacter ruber]TPV32955.1 CcoQ/FixQ family Cbb3-type cytochrome c oxidase assembly chaperone [Paucihalobacter ruber]
MLKFVKNHMDSISGIEIYPIISMLIFFTFFVILFYWVITAKKDYINNVSNIPLDNDNLDNQNNDLL